MFQGFFTFSYIALLSHSGERIACRMRKVLFENIIRQDIEFFDANKTGAVIHRYGAAVCISGRHGYAILSSSYLH